MSFVCSPYHFMSLMSYSYAMPFHDGLVVLDNSRESVQANFCCALVGVITSICLEIL